MEVRPEQIVIDLEDYNPGHYSTSFRSEQYSTKSDFISEHYSTNMESFDRDSEEEAMRKK